MCQMGVATSKQPGQVGQSCKETCMECFLNSDPVEDLVCQLESVEQTAC